MSHDDIDHIPAIVPTRDSEHRRPPGKAGATKGNSVGGRRPPVDKAARGAGGPAILGRLVLTVALVIAAVACTWAWQLQQQLKLADKQMQDYAQRIGDLEDRLSDTDEGMSQNAAVQAAKIRELDSEVRKLWDNVWKQTKERLAKLEQQSASQGKTLGSAEKSLATTQAELKSAAVDIARLKAVADDLERLMASARTSQAEVERVADTLNGINLDLAKLNKRVQGNEEWIGSVNAFRKQANAKLVELQSAVRALQASP
jgi:chromosome segregation ATPase